MRVSYDRELKQLPASYEVARSEPVADLRTEVLRLAAGPARFIGTGGTLALAQLGADLHEELSGQVGAVTTPLGLIQSPPATECGALFFSARARHPDATLTLRRLGAGDYRPSVLVTHRDPSELSEASPDVAIVQLRPPEIREGFLATNSVMAMATMLVRAYGGELPPGLISGLDVIKAPEVAKRGQVLVVYPPNLKAVAIDFETRCAELGVACVQLTDLRNIAHGRHTGLARRAAETTVLILSDKDSSALATKVANVLEESKAAQIRWHVDLSGGAACVRHLATSMHAVGQIAGELEVDAARPRVPQFGRRLYHLPIRNLLRTEPEGPVALKLRALGGRQIGSKLPKAYERAFSKWSKDLAQVSFGGIVLDYDGTVCLTNRRFDLPMDEMRQNLTRLLDAGLAIGFASGRGKSLHEDLRKWVPEKHWEGVTLGLYNGSVRLLLSEALPDLHQPSQLMKAVCERLDASPFSSLVKLETRVGQVTIEIQPDTYFRASTLSALIRDVMAEAPSLPVKVVASGHSVDVVASDTTKVAVLREVADRWGGEVLAVGDQGGSGGNDFELLAATPWSISVDRCSADPSRCWNVDTRGRRGPAALIAILKSLKPKANGATLRIGGGSR